MGETLLVLLRVAVSLGVVIALIVYVGRRLSAGRASERSREADVHVVGRQGLGRHSGVAVIAAGDRRLLVGFSDTQVQLLTELGPVAATPEPMTADRTPVRRTTTSDDRRSAAGPTAAGDPALAGGLPGTGSGPGRAVLPRPRPAPDDAAQRSVLAGSVLSAQTWRAAVRVLQDRTVRR